MIKGVIFDLDGLLIDSEPCWREADFLMAKKYHFPLTDEFRKQLRGMGIKECSQIFIKTFKLPVTNQVLTKARLEFLYKILLKELRLMPFALPLIKKFKQKGYVLALATAGHQAIMAEKILNTLTVADYFSFIISGLEVKKSKPAPDIFLEAAKRMSLLPNQCIVIEDAVNGIMAARGAGMKVIGVNKDEKMRKSLKEAGADFIYKNLNIPLAVFS